MKNIWDTIDQINHNEAESSSMWMKLRDDGDSEVVMFLGEPVMRAMVFENGRSEPWDYAKHAGQKPKRRFLINVLLINSERVKVFEMSLDGIKTLSAVSKKYDFNEWLFEIKRNGAAGNPKTIYSILPEEKLAHGHPIFKTLKAIKLHAIEEFPGVVDMDTFQDHGTVQ